LESANGASRENKRGSDGINNVITKGRSLTDRRKKREASPGGRVKNKIACTDLAQDGVWQPQPKKSTVRQPESAAPKGCDCG